MNSKIKQLKQSGHVKYFQFKYEKDHISFSNFIPLIILTLFFSSCVKEKKDNNHEVCFDSKKNYEQAEGYVYLIKGDSLLPQKITYFKVGQMNVFEGDILVEPTENFGILQKKSAFYKIRSISVMGSLWDNSTVYYEIDPSLSDMHKNNIKTAIDHWRAKTGLKFVERNDEINWVKFRTSELGPSSSAVGMKGGEQFVNISKETSLGNLKHEIGHVVGLFHEHSRKDRKSYITVNESNIIAGKESQFKILEVASINGDYDYGSIMHYPKNAFAKDPSKPTVTPIVSTAVIGQRETLSDLDIKGLKKIYKLK